MAGVGATSNNIAKVTADVTYENTFVDVFLDYASINQRYEEDVTLSENVSLSVISTSVLNGAVMNALNLN